MIGEIKFVLLMAVILVIALLFHHRERKRKQKSIAAYGREILGIREDGAERKLYLDFLRFLSVVLVIATHSFCPAGEVLKNYAYGLLMEGRILGKMEMMVLEIMRYFVTGLGSLALVCNLLFIMISGALLLPFKEEKPGTFYAKRLSRVMIPLAFYYMFYLVSNRHVFFNLPSLWNGIKCILTGPNDLVPHFWMAYLLLGLYIAVPFQRWMLKELPDFVLRGMAAVVLLGSVLRVGFYLIDSSLPFTSLLFSWNGIFYLGYFLTLPCSRVYDRWLFWGGGISAVIILWIFFARGDGLVIATNDSPIMILFASAVFVWFRNRGEKREAKVSRWFHVLVQVGNKYSYSILLIHWMVLLAVLERYFKITSTMFGIYGILLGVLVQMLATLLISFLFCLLFDQTVVLLAQKIWDKLVFFVSRAAMKTGVRKE